MDSSCELQEFYPVMDSDSSCELQEFYPIMDSGSSCELQEFYPVMDSDSSCELQEKTPTRKWPLKNLTVDIHYTDIDVDKNYKKALRKVRNESEAKRWDYYTIYLKHLFPTILPQNTHRIMKKLLKLQDIVSYRIWNTSTEEELVVSNLIHRNEYISKSTKRTGVIVKLFHTHYNNREVMVKVYLYDPHCPSLNSIIESNFENEATFQLYASDLTSVPFISPELYSWGRINEIKLKDSQYSYKCLFLIMEYMDGVILKEATYSTENMRNIYQRVADMNDSLAANLLHHNDLHKGNIMVREIPDSPLPEIIILDFGEASLGPTKRLYKRFGE